MARMELLYAIMLSSRGWSNHFGHMQNLASLVAENSGGMVRPCPRHYATLAGNGLEPGIMGVCLICLWFSCSSGRSEEGGLSSTRKSTNALSNSPTVVPMVAFKVRPSLSLLLRLGRFGSVCIGDIRLMSMGNFQPILNAVGCVFAHSGIRILLRLVWCLFFAKSIE